MQRIKVFLADDHAMVRMGLSALLGTKKDIQVVGEAEDGAETVRKVLALKPDVVLMDLLMPVLNGVDATARILQKLPATKILILTSAGSSNIISQALSAGAIGAVLKSADFSKLLDAIRKVAAGERVIAPDIQKTLKDDPPLPALTPRQEEILTAVTKGLTNADIARLCSIREQSVKEHVNQICEKIGAANRTEAVGIALRKHLLKI